MREDYSMSEKKRKPQIIHVDKLIVKANEVIIREDRNHKRYEASEERENREHKRYEDIDDNRDDRRDPWGFFGSHEGEGRDLNEEDSKKGGFNWF